MRESSTYQAIIEEGEVKALQRTLLRLGQQRFGKPGQRIRATLQAISDVQRPQRMIDRILTADGWQDLLETE